MKKHIIFITVVISIFFFACESDDYLIDGGLHKSKVNMTTYDFLAAHPSFDTLMILIDRAGLKDAINGDVTFFAPTNFSIERFRIARRNQEIAIDPFSDFTLDDLTTEELNKLKMYIIPGKVNRDKMTQDGQVFTTLYGNQVMISLIPVQDWHTQLVSTAPKYVYLTNITGDGPDDPNNVRNVCQTSGIETNNGVLHVLQNSHTLFYFVQTIFAQ